jgi:hypothetical protein
MENKKDLHECAGLFSEDILLANLKLLYEENSVKVF